MRLPPGYHRDPPLAGMRYGNGGRVVYVQGHGIFIAFQQVRYPGAVRKRLEKVLKHSERQSSDKRGVLNLSWARAVRKANGVASPGNGCRYKWIKGANGKWYKLWGTVADKAAKQESQDIQHKFRMAGVIQVGRVR